MYCSLAFHVNSDFLGSQHKQTNTWTLKPSLNMGYHPQIMGRCPFPTAESYGVSAQIGPAMVWGSFRKFNRRVPLSAVGARYLGGFYGLRTCVKSIPIKQPTGKNKNKTASFQQMEETNPNDQSVMYMKPNFQSKDILTWVWLKLFNSWGKPRVLVRCHFGDSII